MTATKYIYDPSLVASKTLSRTYHQADERTVICHMHDEDGVIVTSVAYTRIGNVVAEEVDPATPPLRILARKISAIWNYRVW